MDYSTRVDRRSPVQFLLSPTRQAQGWLRHNSALSFRNTILNEDRYAQRVTIANHGTLHHGGKGSATYLPSA